LLPRGRRFFVILITFYVSREKRAGIYENHDLLPIQVIVVFGREIGETGPAVNGFVGKQRIAVMSPRQALKSRFKRLSDQLGQRHA
jgi:hypothetical protein